MCLKRQVVKRQIRQPWGPAPAIRFLAAQGGRSASDLEVILLRKWAGLLQCLR